MYNICHCGYMLRHESPFGDSTLNRIAYIYFQIRTDPNEHRILQFIINLDQTGKKKDKFHLIWQCSRHIAPDTNIGLPEKSIFSWRLRSSIWIVLLFPFSFSIFWRFFSVYLKKICKLCKFILLNYTNLPRSYAWCENITYGNTSWMCVTWLFCNFKKYQFCTSTVRIA